MVGTTTTDAQRADFERCREALRHYENFNVVSYFIPARLRPHFWALYAFCRAVDDLGDEYDGDRLRALDAFESATRQAFEGKADTPEFRALAETIERHALPMEEFLALITANRMDQITTHYQTFDALLGYCRHSANPVGRLVLGIFGFHDPTRQALSDSVCTGLQLANFCQDVDRDLAQGRQYLPEEDLLRFGVTPEMLAGRTATVEVRRLIAFEVARARDWLEQGAPLETMVPRRLAWQLRLYRLGGHAILNALAKQAFDPFRRRPEVGTLGKLGVAWHAIIGGGGPVFDRQ